MIEKLKAFFKWADIKLAARLQWCANNVGEVLSLFGLILLALALMEETRWLWVHSIIIVEGNEVVTWTGEATRSLGLALSALAGLYALVLAARRLRVSEANLFNDRLKNGITFLGSDNRGVRCSGITLLEGYARDDFITAWDRHSIVDALTGFVRERCAPEGEEIKRLAIDKYAWVDMNETEIERRDIQQAISALARLVSADDIKTKVNLGGLDLRGFNLCGLDFSFFNFGKSNLSDVDFSNCTFKETDFSHSRLASVLFVGADCINTKFDHAYLKKSEFEFSSLREGTTFAEANLEGSRFHYLKSFDVIFGHTDVSLAQMDVEQTPVFEGYRKIIYEENRYPSISVGEKSMLTGDLPSPQVESYIWVHRLGEWQCDFGEDANGTTVKIIAPWWKQLDPPPSDA